MSKQPAFVPYGEPLEPRLVLSFSNYDQLLVELVNYTRMHPQEEANRLLGGDLNRGLAAGTISTSPKQPVGWNRDLYEAAQRHTDRMLELDFFDHTDPVEHSSPGDRAEAAGYYWDQVGENLAYRASTAPLNYAAEISKIHDDLFLSPSHRENMLDPVYRELGVATEIGSFQREDGTYPYTLMASEEFGLIEQDGPFLTGVVFNDRDGDRFYDVNEGLGGVRVRVAGSAGTFVTTSLPTGGYQLLLPEGGFTVIMTREGLREQFQVQITNSSNVKRDVRTNPWRMLVTELYRDVLGRWPDSAGLNHWAAVLQNGTPRPQVVDAFWNSSEHRGRQVDELYSTYLDRMPDGGGRTHWISMLQNGMSEIELARILVTSGEYNAAHASPAAYVDGLYSDVLGRPASASERNHWVTYVSSCTCARDNAARTFVTADEEYRQIITGYYVDFLERQPDSVGLDHWLRSMRNGMPPTGVARSLLVSAEYFVDAGAA